MKLLNPFNMLKIVTLFLHIYLGICTNLWDYEVSNDELLQRVKTFNSWYKERNPNAGKIEARVFEGSRIGIVATEELKV